MIDATPVPGDALWWLLRLGKRLYADIPRFNDLERYWLGDPPLPYGNKKMREAYVRLQRQARTNFGGLVTEAVLERMKVTGFRAGGDASVETDKTAWGWWQDNNLDSDQALVHRAAAVMSRSYVLCGLNDHDEDDLETTPGVLVTVEDPRQVIHEASPENRRNILAGLKTWWDDVENCQFAVLMLPDEIHYFRTVDRKKDDQAPIWDLRFWEYDTSENPDGIAPNPLHRPPMVVFVNRPMLSGYGIGEFEDTIDILDRINTTILDRLVVQAMQAYRQRYVTGMEVTDENGRTEANFDPGADLLWAIPDEKAQFGEFNPTDIGSILKGVEADVCHLAAITRTPASYLLAGIVNVSGNALALTETGLVSKIEEREGELGNSWEEVYRMVGDLLGSPVARDCEVVWKDPQFRSMNEMASASVQLMNAGVTWRTRMRLLGFSPQDIERMEAERLQEAMLASILAPLSMAEGGMLGNRGVTYTEPGVLPGAVGAASPAPAPAAPAGGPAATQPANSTPAKAGTAAGTQARHPMKRPANPGGGRTGPKP